MQNFTQSDEDTDKTGDQDKSRQRNAIQREIIMTEADQRKFLNEKNALEMEIRQLRHEEDRLKIELKEKQSKLERNDYEILQIDNQIKGLKKKLNLL